MDDGVVGDPAGWSLVWSEEFDGAAGSPADPAIWRPEVGGHGWGNDELQYYTDSVENAALDGPATWRSWRGMCSHRDVIVVSAGVGTPRRD
jgi:hypothetical protein